MSLPTQIFQINEPIFFGLPIVLNPIFMVPYVLNALFLTAATYALMTWGLIRRPFINVPWTTPPILGHYLVTGGDWRAAVWGVVSIVMAMAVYYPFARVAFRLSTRVFGRPVRSFCETRRLDQAPVTRILGGCRLVFMARIRMDGEMKKFNLVALAIAAAAAAMTAVGAQAPGTYLQKTRTFHSAEAREARAER